MSCLKPHLMPVKAQDKAQGKVERGGTRKYMSLERGTGTRFVISGSCQTAKVGT